MTTEPVQIQGITQEDIQRLIQTTVNEYGKKKGSGIFLFDTSYIYNFHKSDFSYIQKLNKIPRYKPEVVIDWHRILERWYNDQTVAEPFGREIKPIQIVRQFDKIVNEGLEMIASCLTGGGDTTFKYHAIGDGADAGDDPLPGDTALVHQVNRIDVTSTGLGGSLSRDGSTLYIVGNHPITLETTDFTETGVFDHSKSPDMMLDHSIFPAKVTHNKNEDVQGSTTIVYMCGV